MVWSTLPTARVANATVTSADWSHSLTTSVMSASGVLMISSTTSSGSPLPVLNHIRAMTCLSFAAGILRVIFMMGW